MKKYWVTLGYDYEVWFVEEIDETLKDGEVKSGNNYWAIAEPVRNMTKGGVTRVTLSGNYSVEVEADSEEDAKQKAPLACLKDRVKNLEESLQRESAACTELLGKNTRLTNEYNLTQNRFMSIIRSGELNIVNTGKRIIGTWYSKEGERSFEFETLIDLGILVERIQGLSVDDDDCY